MLFGGELDSCDSLASVPEMKKFCLMQAVTLCLVLVMKQDLYHLYGQFGSLLNCDPFKQAISSLN